MKPQGKGIENGKYLSCHHPVDPLGPLGSGFMSDFFGHFQSTQKRVAIDRFMYRSAR